MLGFLFSCQNRVGAIRSCVHCCRARMLLRQTVLRTLLPCEDVAARDGAADACWCEDVAEGSNEEVRGLDFGPLISTFRSCR